MEPQQERGQYRESEPATALYRPSLQHADVANNDNCHVSLGAVEPTTVDQCHKIPEMDDSQLVGGAGVAARVEAGFAALAEFPNGLKLADNSTGKRRRGRPPKSQPKITPLTTPPQRKKRDEEDVCFICFDGGSLVLCDRRGCPKAYHPACIKRDESFFRSKAKWNCGWHICSSCQKASHYMCYTCTYSLCKGCTKDADYVCVRGNKGFCGTCMRTVMLIENSAFGNKEMVQVDFDDKTSWEYLFKVYWIFLKEKLSLSLDELTKAKNPWKGPAIMAPKGESLVEIHSHNAKGSNLEKSCGGLATSNSKRRKTIKQQKFLSKEDPLVPEKPGVIKVPPFPECTSWATKELLEFVAYMKNGDTSVLSHFDVQALLLEYVARNNLRDPHQKSQILCDMRLINLFGKVRVGHFEMLKLLDSHILIQDHSKTVGTVRSGVIEAVAGQFATDGISDNQLMMPNDKRRKTRKKVDETRQQINPDEYAAIDVHNINLIYLKRDLMESLIDDADKFHEMVAGSIVRVQISGNGQKQDMHRLVQIIGTSKAAEPYKIGTRTTTIMLEILNLDKKEVVSMEEISNQEFSEDECSRLRQSIKCGLIKGFMVGEIQKKAMALQAVRVNVSLESEILRLNHLRDRANEKGQRKELRECVEKLELLNSPEERQRRLCEIPEVHTDPNMKPNNESEHAGDWNERKKDNHVKQGSCGFGTKERGLVSYVSSDIGCRENITIPHHVGMEPSICNSETDKIWHYQDPFGKVQGPFPMMLLCRWSMSGHFPPHLRIWRVNEKQDDSILLTDALGGWYSKQTQFHNNSLPTRELRVPSDGGDNNSDAKGSGDMSVKQIESKNVEESWKLMQNMASGHSNGSSEFVRGIDLDSPSSPCTTSADAVNFNGKQSESPLRNGDCINDDGNLAGQHQVCTSFASSTVPGSKSQLQKVSEGIGVDGLDPGPSIVDDDLNKTTEPQLVPEHGKEGDNEGKSDKSCEQSWRSPPVNSSSNGWDSNTDLVSFAKSLEASPQSKDIGFPDLPSPTPKSINEDLKAQATENKQSLSSNVPVQDSGPSWGTVSSLVVGGSQLREVDGEWDGYSRSTAKPPVEEWDSNLVSESSLKPTDVTSDHAATPTSGSGQLTHSSPTHPGTDASSWQAIVPEPNDFTSLGDDSVSDLLAEVEAMESLNGLASPTSILRCGGELTQGSEHDCFSPVEGLSPAPDLGKNDALSSTSDLPLHSQSTATNEPFGVSQADLVDAQKNSGGHSSTSAVMDEDPRPSDSSVNQSDAGLDVQPPPPAAPVTSWGMAGRDTSWRAGSGATGANWGSVQANVNLNWGGLVGGHGGADAGLGMGQVNRVQESGSLNLNSGSYAGNVGYWGSQPRYFGPRERDFHGRDSSFGRGRSSWNRQSFFPGANGGGFRPPPKGQRVCKFYESGYCKKGAACSYLHP